MRQSDEEPEYFEVIKVDGRWVFNDNKDIKGEALAGDVLFEACRDWKVGEYIDPIAVLHEEGRAGKLGSFYRPLLSWTPTDEELAEILSAPLPETPKIRKVVSGNNKWREKKRARKHRED